MNNRYVRQIILPEIGEAGQQKLQESAVLVVGAGGLGSPVTLYLAAAGVGHITIADADEVRLNNLNRQILYKEDDLGQPKVECAKKHLKDFNGGIKIETIGLVNESNIYEVLSKKNYDVVVDCLDNFQTRYVLNNACVEKRLPFVYGSVLGWTGQISVFDAKSGPCYQCVYPEPPPVELSPTCFQAGVIGVAPAIVGVIEASETLKLIMKLEKTLMSKMVLVDLLKLQFKTVELKKDEKCPCCCRN